MASSGIGNFEIDVLKSRYICFSVSFTQHIVIHRTSSRRIPSEDVIWLIKLVIACSPKLLILAFKFELSFCFHVVDIVKGIIVKAFNVGLKQHSWIIVEDVTIVQISIIFSKFV